MRVSIYEINKLIKFYKKLLSSIDGYDSTDIRFSWFDPNTGESCQHSRCMKIHVYNREMSNFYLIEAMKSVNKTRYNARE